MDDPYILHWLTHRQERTEEFTSLGEALNFALWLVEHGEGVPQQITRRGHEILGETGLSTFIRKVLDGDQAG